MSETWIGEWLKQNSVPRDQKARFVGCSNCDAAQLHQAHGLVRYESLQPHYNLAHRADYEGELMALCAGENRAFAVVDKLETVAQAHNPTITSAITSASTVEQLTDTLVGADLSLTAEEKASLDAVSAWPGRLGDRSRITLCFDMRFASKITQIVQGYF